MYRETLINVRSRLYRYKHTHTHTRTEKQRKKEKKKRNIQTISNSSELLLCYFPSWTIRSVAADAAHVRFGTPVASRNRSEWRASRARTAQYRLHDRNSDCSSSRSVGFAPATSGRIMFLTLVSLWFRPLPSRIYVPSLLGRPLHFLVTFAPLSLFIFRILLSFEKSWPNRIPSESNRQLGSFCGIPIAFVSVICSGGCSVVVRALVSFPFRFHLGSLI